MFIIFTGMKNENEILVKIYKLIDPITNEIRYIGRTINPLHIRLRGHLSKAKNNKSNIYVKNWINSLLKKGLKPKIELLTEVEGWSKSHQFEQWLIKIYLETGFKLVNFDDRGEGNINKIITPEQKIKISETVKKRHKEGIYNLTLGKVPINVYDLEGNLVKECESITACAKWLNITVKHLDCALRRKAKKTKNYQIRRKIDEKPSKYINDRSKIICNNKIIYLYDIEKRIFYKFKAQKYCMMFLNVKGSSYLNYYKDTNKIIKQKYRILSQNAYLKQEELLETPTTVIVNEDNQQPSLDSNIFEGSTTNIQFLIDNAKESNDNTSILPLHSGILDSIPGAFK
jgi:hypothetical protein